MGKRPEGNRELYKYIGHQIKLARLDNTPARLDGQKSPSAICLLYTSPSPRDKRQCRMPSSA